MPRTTITPDTLVRLSERVRNAERDGLPLPRPRSEVTARDWQATLAWFQSDPSPTTVLTLAEHLYDDRPVGNTQVRYFLAQNWLEVVEPAASEPISLRTLMQACTAASDAAEKAWDAARYASDRAAEAEDMAEALIAQLVESTAPRG